MKNIILFDLDGTLIDSTEAIVSTFYHSFKQMNYDYKGNDENIKSLIGYPLDLMYEKLGINKNLITEFVTSYKNRYKIISKEQTKLLSLAKEALKHANSFARLAVVTTKTGIYSEELLIHMDIMKYFEYVIGREHVTNPKPHPEPINKTLELMNVSPSTNVWMVGDTKLDLIAAKEANINSVGVLCGYGKKETLEKYTSNIELNSYEAVKFIENQIIK